MKINEIFYSIQGEGYHTGRAGVFVRFSGCNLKCPFCDTDFKSYKNMTEDEVVEAVLEADTGVSKFVILTGGEPSMQITHSLLEKLHTCGYYIAIESNGAYADLEEYDLDWVTISPKNPYLLNQNPLINTRKANEIKLVVDPNYTNEGIMEWCIDEIEADYYYLQPCDTGDSEYNKFIIEATVELLKRNPQWKLSLQTQKILGVR